MRAKISESFIKGFGKALNLGGTKEWPDIDNNETKDYEALRGDWEYVGKYIRESISRCTREAR